MSTSCPPPPALSDTHTVSRNATSGHPHEAPWPTSPAQSWTAKPSQQAETETTGADLVPRRNHSGFMGRDLRLVESGSARALPEAKYANPGKCS